MEMTLEFDEQTYLSQSLGDEECFDHDQLTKEEREELCDLEYQYRCDESKNIKEMICLFELCLDSLKKRYFRDAEVSINLQMRERVNNLIRSPLREFMYRTERDVNDIKTEIEDYKNGVNTWKDYTDICYYELKMKALLPTYKDIMGNMK